MVDTFFLLDVPLISEEILEKVNRELDCKNIFVEFSAAFKDPSNDRGESDIRTYLSQVYNRLSIMGYESSAQEVLFTSTLVKKALEKQFPECFPTITKANMEEAARELKGKEIPTEVAYLFQGNPYLQAMLVNNYLRLSCKEVLGAPTYLLTEIIFYKALKKQCQITQSKNR